NQAFLDLARRPENLFDDGTQTGLRDMYLLNVESAIPDLPAEEKRGRLDAANREFCQAVLDRRLEVNPAGISTMLDAPAVQRALGPEATAEYRRRGAAAVADDAIRAGARAWAESGLAPAEAEAAAAKRYADDGERNQAMAGYWQVREAESRRQAIDNLMAVDAAWRSVVASPNGDTAQLDAIRRRDPAAAARLEAAVTERRRTGGVPEQPDYAFLLQQCDDFDGRAAAESLRDPEQAWQVYHRLGGGGSAEFDRYVRLFAGEGTAEDRGRLENLRTARDLAMAQLGRQLQDNECNRFLAAYDDNVRVFQSRNGYQELTRAEHDTLARQALMDMGWTNRSLVVAE
ncbi:MAG: hypothetical protein LIP77_04835, partial [Planctomycetes bacterium]|nr:hypothetical protein [Planctomycetota bacterium]